MKNTFQNKVTAERAVLKVVNRDSSGDKQLGDCLGSLSMRGSLPVVQWRRAR